jgi:hypothetical protein
MHEKRKGNELTAESDTRFPAPVVNDTAAPPEPSWLARVTTAITTAFLPCWFYYFQVHVYTSFRIGTF